ncbi:MAG: tRNA (adenosine(37)-N6)-threonylcarbamoyltransferase complex dimerization subunit type 1 TsaB [Planctomycetes bacterium]|nr:tRNA (adenosine(37)-N6)-threonylcarbamoyltransferase complex dimerization subunit type 1 TsaB [Planctomycetota bacterium]
MTPTPRWLLALESSTAHGGAALLRDGEVVAVERLSEGLRHGRELLPAAAGLTRRHNLRPTDLAAVAVSMGPGSYTGIRVGVMAAKALAYASGARLVAVSSLAALAQSIVLNRDTQAGDIIYTLQDARRDEVYAGLYENDGGIVRQCIADAAITPEEAAGYLREFRADNPDATVHLIGSGFSTYFDLFRELTVVPGRVDPGAVGALADRQFLREEYADPMALQPVYLRRDEGADWRHDHLITGS